MSYLSRLAVAGLLAASLVPAAQARPAGPSGATQALVIQSAQSAFAPGRAAERATPAASDSLVSAPPQYANGSDDGYLG